MEPKQIQIAPSLLSANFANLAEDVKKCETGQADLLHVDVMDGHFVPNITIGPLIVEAIRPLTRLPLDCHLMISEPDKYITLFAKAGANMISVHAEVLAHLHRTLTFIKSFGIKAGVVLNPVTPLHFAYDAAEHCDFILLMSVNPGFGGQHFIPASLKRIDNLKNYLIKNNLEHVEIEVDGGIKFDNVADVVRAGANIIVCGSGLFKGDLINNIQELRKRAESTIVK